MPPAFVSYFAYFGYSLLVVNIMLIFMVPTAFSMMEGEKSVKHSSANHNPNQTDYTQPSLACASVHLDTLKYLVEVHHCDPKCELSNIQ